MTSGIHWTSDLLDFGFATYVWPDTAVPTPAPSPTPGSSLPPTPAPLPSPSPFPSRPPAATVRTVLVIVLPTSGLDAESGLRKSLEVADYLEQATAHRGYSDPSAQPYLRYRLLADAVIVEETLPRRLPNGNFDIGELYQRHSVCARASAGEVDEVWIWDGGGGGFPEWTTNGPEWSTANGTGMPNCGRQMTTMIYTGQSGPDLALHSYGHRLEMTWRQYFPCDFTTDTWPWPAESADCHSGTASDRTGFVGRPFEGNDWVGVCGDVHAPPNQPYGQIQAYDYGNRQTAMSICEDWHRDGTSVASEISCLNWGCTHEGYLVWWMQRLPGLGVSRDRLGTPQPNWWPYIFGRPTPTATPTSGFGTGTPTPSPATGTAPTPDRERSPSPSVEGHRIFLPITRTGERP